ncbi:hypothetical protein KC19_2G249000 [Ceratodon purpureus]|uniref:Uncharacterized protein n=1 Tax=Ceratodon purpureus TaxID=3225 RepID=A0A8T0IXP8_CERPU|nr:hypothetical protein KC19_2G249000 [Ceratodon purpureus]
MGCMYCLLLQLHVYFMTLRISEVTLRFSNSAVADA